MFSEKDYIFMEEAIKLAKKAETVGEVPVGAVVIFEDQIIGQGFNQSITLNDPSAHAEMVALRQAALAQKNYRLVNTTLYVTLEPCVMCLGAISHARVQRVVYGAQDLRAGAVVSAFQLGETQILHHRPKYESGIYRHECTTLLVDFFKKKRLKNAKRNELTQVN